MRPIAVIGLLVGAWALVQANASLASQRCPPGSDAYCPAGSHCGYQEGGHWHCVPDAPWVNAKRVPSSQQSH